MLVLILLPVCVKFFVFCFKSLHCLAIKTYLAWYIYVVLHKHRVRHVPCPEELKVQGPVLWGAKACQVPLKSTRAEETQHLTGSAQQPAAPGLTSDKTTEEDIGQKYSSERMNTCYWYREQTREESGTMSISIDNFEGGSGRCLISHFWGRRPRASSSAVIYHYPTIDSPLSGFTPKYSTRKY